MNAFALLRERCGLSQREAAATLDVRLDTVKKWSTSKRHPTPPRVIAELRLLYAAIERAAREALAVIEAEGARAEAVELGLAADDHEARGLGWPCVGAHGAVLGLIAAGTRRPVIIVPRGSTPPGAAAADIHDQHTQGD